MYIDEFGNMHTIYDVITAIKILNLFSTSKNPLGFLVDFFFFFFFLWWEHNMSLTENLYLKSYNSPLPPSQSPDNHHSVSAFMNLAIVDTWYTWNHAVFVPLWRLTSFSIISSKIHPYCCRCQDFLIFEMNILCYVYTTFSLSIHLSRTLGYFYIILAIS